MAWFLFGNAIYCRHLQQNSKTFSHKLNQEMHRFQQKVSKFKEQAYHIIKMYCIKEQLCKSCFMDLASLLGFLNIFFESTGRFL